MMNEKKDILTVEEFAKEIAVHPNTVRKMIRCGRLNAFKVGNGKKASYRICRNEIERMAAYDYKELIDDIVKNIMEERKNKEI